MDKTIKELRAILESLKEQAGQLLGGVHYKLRQLPESEDTDFYLRAIHYLRDMLTDAAGCTQELYDSISSDITEMEKSSGGPATARTSKPNTTNKGENTDGKNH